jgi:pimeloyl-ACP methyl ester carboxylesterase
VERVILVDILPDIEAERLPRDLTDLGAVALLSGPREFSTFDAMVDAAIAAAGPGRSAANLRRGVWHNAKQTPTGYWVWRYDDLLASRSYSTSSLWACVAGMSSPLTLVKGGESPFITDAAIARLRQLRDDAEVIVVPGAGHSVQSAAPATLAALILERLSQATTSSSSNTA